MEDSINNDLKNQQIFGVNKSLSKEEIINQALALHSQGNLKEAANYYQYFINQGFIDYRVFTNYGVILRGFGKLEQAELLQRKAIEIKPDSAQSYSNLASILLSLGKLNEAELSARKGIKLDPKLINCYYNLGNILENLGCLDEAKLNILKAIELKPDFAEAYLNLGVIFNKLGSLEESKIATLKAIELKPECAESYLNLGVILKKLGLLDEAEIEARKAIEIRSDYAEAYLNLGNILHLNNKYEEATKYLRKSIELKPDLVEAKMNLERIANKLVPKWHIPMMNDNNRNNAYLEAIKLAIKGNEYVLDIGTGSGILSMIAIDAGAKKVISCETSKPIANMAENIISKNGYSDKVKVINKNSTELLIGKELNTKADIIISEILSSEFVGEGVQFTIFDANQRLLKENGKMIPEGGEIRVALLKDQASIRNEIFVDKVLGYDLSDFNTITGNKFDIRDTNMNFSILSEPKVAFVFDFYQKHIIHKQEKIIEINVIEDGLCMGLTTWLKLNLYESIYYENNPNGHHKSHWTNPIYTFSKPLKVSKGQLIRIKATLLLDEVWYELI